MFGVRDVAGVELHTFLASTAISLVTWLWLSVGINSDNIRLPRADIRTSNTIMNCTLSVQYK